MNTNNENLQESEEFEKFEALNRKLGSVPKKNSLEREVEEEAPKTEARKPRS